jgi:hypothetical protein
MFSIASGGESMSNCESNPIRSPSEILEFLDTYYARIMERPSMYSYLPEAMETMISFIEELRAFILEPARQNPFVLNDPKQRNQFDDYMTSLGYGSMGISHVEGTVKRITSEELALFDKVVDVLKRFLEKEGRLAQVVKSVE